MVIHFTKKDYDGAVGSVIINRVYRNVIRVFCDDTTLEALLQSHISDMIIADSIFITGLSMNYDTVSMLEDRFLDKKLHYFTTDATQNMWLCMYYWARVSTDESGRYFGISQYASNSSLLADYIATKNKNKWGSENDVFVELARLRILNIQPDPEDQNNQVHEIATSLFDEFNQIGIDKFIFKYTKEINLGIEII